MESDSLRNSLDSQAFPVNGRSEITSGMHRRWIRTLLAVNTSMCLFCGTIIGSLIRSDKGLNLLQRCYSGSPIVHSLGYYQNRM